MFKLALDAGHGKNTSGKRCNKKIDPNQTREWVLNNRICCKITERLQAYEGYELLRVDDTTGVTDVNRKDRCTKANEWGADLYLSIHHNAAGKVFSGGGIVSYIRIGADDALVALQKKLYDALIKATGLKGNRASPLCKKNFDVLYYTKMPAILMENGFMDSTVDCPVILTEEFADKAAEAYVEVIAEIGGLTKKPVKESVTWYKVQVGAFKKKENANAMLAKLKESGFSGMIVKC